MKKTIITLFILLFSISIFGNISTVSANKTSTSTSGGGGTTSGSGGSTSTSGGGSGGSTSGGGGSTSSIDNVNAGDLLNKYKPKKVVGSSSGDMDLDGGFKDKVNSYLGTISTILGVIAVGALVYAGMLMQFSGGEDEKVSRAKKIIKWAIIGFILLISASAIVYIIINVMFALG